MVKNMRGLQVFILASAMLATPTALCGQSHSPELFGSIGYFRAGSDEGRIATGISYGGTITVQVRGRLAADLDIQTSEVINLRSADDFYRTRRTLVIPNLLYRWAHPRGHIFAGAGIGAEFTDSLTREDNFRADFTPVGWKEIRPRVFELEHADTRKVLFAPRVGFSVFPKRHLGLRADLYIANWHMGARIGVGVRF
jgi:hypothetical protein